MEMRIERTDSEIILRLPLNTDLENLQRLIDYMQIKEVLQYAQGNDEVANQLAEESKENWWKENKKRFIK